VSVALSLLPEEIEHPAHKIKRHYKDRGHPLNGRGSYKCRRAFSLLTFKATTVDPGNLNRHHNILYFFTLILSVMSSDLMG